MPIPTLVNNNLFGHITALVDQNVPDLISPVVPQTQTFHGEEEAFDLNTKRLRVYAKDSPFSKTQVRNIIHNMALTEALTATKTSDRLAALTLAGKSNSVDYFTAEKREVTVSAKNLKASIENRLQTLFSEDIVDGEFVEVPE